MDRRPEHRRRPPPGAPAHAPDAKETAARLAPALGPGMARVPVMAGTGSGLPPGRPAATMRDELVFGTAGPPAEQVAHELVHAAQARRFGPGPAGGGTAAPGAADEREARELTPRVLMGEPVAVRQAPTAPVRLWTPDPEPETRPGAFELRQAAEAYKTDRVIEILAANREPEHMAALRAGYGPAFFRDLERALAAGETRTLWSLATVYIGDQLSLAERIRVEDKVFGRDLDKIMPLIEAISDEEALRIVGGEAPFPRPLDAPPPGVAPAQAFLADVQAALDDALRREDYYQAMNLLLAKASRANAKRWAETGSLLRLQPAPSSQLHVLPSVPGQVTIDLTGTAAGGPATVGGRSMVWSLDTEDILTEPPAEDAGGPGEPIYLELLGDPASALRIQFATELVERADEHMEFGLIFRDREPLLGSAMLALGVLNRGERRAAWGRLRERKWQGFNTDQVELLRRLVLFPDDAQVLVRATIQAAADPVHQEGQLAVAAATAKSMLDEARQGAAASKDPARREELELQLARAQREFANLSFQSAIGATTDYAGSLVALGADPVRVSYPAMRRIDTADGLFNLVKEIPPKARLDEQFQRVVRHKAAEQLRFSKAQLEALDAYLNLASDDKAGTSFNKVALRELMAAKDEEAPGRAIGLLHRMTREQRQRFVAWEPYRQWHEGLLKGNYDSIFLHYWLRDANAGRTVEAMKSAAQFVHWMTPKAKPRLWEQSAYEEWVAARGDNLADRRRGFALWSQLQENKSLKLDEGERKLVEAYAEHRRLVEDLGGSDRERVDEVFFGQPQIVTGTEGPLNPTAEADYMFARVAGRRGLETTWRTVVDDVRHWRGTYLGPAITEFLLTYGEQRTAGITQGSLAILADLYHRAMREADEIKRDEELASVVASIVACVVAIGVVMILSGGTLGPLAIGAVAALAGGTAAATAGALMRQESTGLEVLRDFGTGAVEGAMAVAGSAIAARVVRALSAGSAAVEAGAAAGAAVETATGARAAAHIATAVVDGAVSGAAGEVFRTATDEATWDRGASEALSRVLSAIGRGALMGGAGGFAIAGGLTALGGLLRVTRRFGQAVAAGVADLLEGSRLPLTRLDNLSEPAIDALVEAQRLAAAGDIDGALATVRKVQQAGELTAADALKVERTLRSIRIVEATIEPGLDRAEILSRLEEVSETEFARRTGNARGNAFVEIGPDGPRVIVKARTDPLAVAEEVQHLRQWATDPLMRGKMERIGGQTPESWAKLGTVERAGLHLEKLEVEADVQRRIIAGLEQRAAAGEAAAADRIAAAQDTLDALGNRIDTVADSLDDVARGAGTKRLEDLDLQRPPQMFSKERPTRAADPTKAPNWRKVRRSGVLAENPDANPEKTAEKLDKLGYDVERDRNGLIRKIRAKPGTRASQEAAQLTIIESEKGVRSIAPGDPRPTWEKRHADAARRFKGMQRDLKVNEALKAQHAAGKVKLTSEQLTRVNQALEQLNPEFMAKLEARIKAGTLSEGGAGLLAPWNRFIDDLHARTGLSYDELLAPITKTGGKLPEAGYDELRRSLRALGAEQLNAIPLGKARREALDTMLALQPDNRSKGELYTAYLRGGRDPAGPVHRLEVPFEAPFVSGSRQPDDVAWAAQLRDQVPPGLYGAEHKAGPEAFRLNQAEEYARALLKKGGPVTTTGEKAGWDGIVYSFSTIDEAKVALAKLQGNPFTSKVLGRERLGIHVLYTNPSGQLVRLPGH